MNINYAKGIVVLIVLACVLHTNCAKTEKSLSKSDSGKLEKSASNLSNDKENNDSVKQMLLNIASIIQDCIDKNTMNNKDFKIKLDDLYKDLVNSTIKQSIKKYTKKVIKIKQKYEKDLKVLEIMNSGADSESSKTKNKSSKNKSIKQ